MIIWIDICDTKVNDLEDVIRFNFRTGAAHWIPVCLDLVTYAARINGVGIEIATGSEAAA